MEAECLSLEVKCAPKLVARVRCVATQRRPVALAVSILATAAGLDVVLSHGTDDVNDLNGRVATVVANAGNPGGILSDGRSISGPANPWSSARKLKRLVAASMNEGRFPMATASHLRRDPGTGDSAEVNFNSAVVTYC